MVADLPVLGHNQTGRSIEPKHARRLRFHESVLNGHGDRTDRAVTAHGKAAGGLDEQDADVAVRPRRRIEDGAGHDVVAARFEH